MWGNLLAQERIPLGLNWHWIGTINIRRSEGCPPHLQNDTSIIQSIQLNIPLITCLDNTKVSLTSLSCRRGSTMMEAIFQIWGKMPPTYLRACVTFLNPQNERLLARCSRIHIICIGMGCGFFTEDLSSIPLENQRNQGLSNLKSRTEYKAYTYTEYVLYMTRPYVYYVCWIDKWTPGPQMDRKS
jgi:hypothetical protein